MPQVLNLPGPGPLVQPQQGANSGAPRALAAVVSGAGTVVGALTVASALRATVTGAGSLAARLNENPEALRTTITGTGSLAADLRVTRALRTLISGGATVVAGVKLAELLRASLTGQGVLTASLTVTSSGRVVGLLDTRDHQLYIASIF